MTRTRLRGLEIGEIQFGIEVLDACPWEWPESPVAEFACLPRNPEVHVGLRVAELSSADLGGECYGLGAWTFEVARCGEDWLLGLSRRGNREHLATFDSEFRSGEVLVCPEVGKSRRFPLLTPLDEWIVVHRTVTGGGLILNATASSVEGGAHVRLGPSHAKPEAPNRRITPRATLFGRDTVLLREARGSLRNFRTPWNDAMDPHLGYSAPVAELFVVEETVRAYRECLDPDDAAEQLVNHAIVPLCDEALLDRVLRNAQRLAGRMPLHRCGEVAAAPPPARQSLHGQNGFGSRPSSNMS
jgi:hypothetical protein